MSGCFKISRSWRHGSTINFLTGFEVAFFVFHQTIRFGPCHLITIWVSRTVVAAMCPGMIHIFLCQSAIVLKRLHSRRKWRSVGPEIDPFAYFSNKFQAAGVSPGLSPRLYTSFFFSTGRRRLERFILLDYPR